MRELVLDQVKCLDIGVGMVIKPPRHEMIGQLASYCVALSDAAVDAQKTFHVNLRSGAGLPPVQAVRDKHQRES